MGFCYVLNDVGIPRNIVLCDFDHQCKKLSNFLFLILYPKMTDDDFKIFVEANFRINNSNEYIAIESSDNRLRHFGVKTTHGLSLDLLEVLFLYCVKKYGNELYDTDRVKAEIHSRYPGITNLFMAYLYMKQHSYNILRVNGKLSVYEKRADFNRFQDEPISKLSFVEHHSKFTPKKEDNIIGVLGREQFCLIQTKSLKRLSKDCPQVLYKQ